MGTDIYSAARAKIGLSLSQNVVDNSEINIFKDIECFGLSVYVNSKSEMFIPTSLWLETKSNQNGIFDAMPSQIIVQLMEKQEGFSFIMEPMDIFANFADIKGNKAFFSILFNNLKLRFTPDSLQDINTLLEHFETVKICKDLKMYRPQRRPCTATLSPKYYGKDEQELPERVRRKRKLIVRDWFFYVVWFIRLKKIRRNIFSEAIFADKLSKKSPKEIAAIFKAA